MKSKATWTKVTGAILDRLRLTQAELAERCGVAQQSVSGWKTGARTPGRSAQRHLVRLARAAGLSGAAFRPYPVEEAPALGIADQPSAKPVAGDDARFAETAEWVRLLEALPEVERREWLEATRLKVNRKPGADPPSQ